MSHERGESPRATPPFSNTSIVLPLRFLIENSMLFPEAVLSSSRKLPSSASFLPQ